jgi:hypothetical protein
LKPSEDAGAKSGSGTHGGSDKVGFHRPSPVKPASSNKFEEWVSNIEICEILLDHVADYIGGDDRPDHGLGKLKPLRDANQETKRRLYNAIGSLKHLATHASQPSPSSAFLEKLDREIEVQTAAKEKHTAWVLQTIIRPMYLNSQPTPELCPLCYKGKPRMCKKHSKEAMKAFDRVIDRGD